jgi:ADP-ribose pyrophosphatase YjhB (NUDIX family)
MRPPDVDTNLYSYHLKLLIRQGFIEKTDQGYTLTMPGQAYIDRVNLVTTKRTLQPKIITLLIIQDGYGNVLMYPKRRQPFMGQWTLPLGKVHNSDTSVRQAVQREIAEKISQEIAIDAQHVGDAYIRIKQGDDVLMSTLAHVFYGQVEGLEEPNEYWRWVPLRSLDERDTAPAISDIIARTLFRDPFFFEEFDVSW